MNTWTTETYWDQQKRYCDAFLFLVLYDVRMYLHEKLGLKLWLIAKLSASELFFTSVSIRWL
jgi:hypothetical protein